MNSIQEKLANLSKDVDLMSGSIPEDASLQLVAAQIHTEVEHMQSWVERQGPRHPSPGEVANLRGHLRRLETLSHRVMGFNKEREGLDAEQSETGINVAEDGEVKPTEVPTEEEAVDRNVEEIMPPADQTENDMREAEPHGFSQEKVGE